MLLLLLRLCALRHCIALYLSNYGLEHTNCIQLFQWNLIHNSPQIFITGYSIIVCNISPVHNCYQNMNIVCLNTRAVDDYINRVGGWMFLYFPRLRDCPNLLLLFDSCVFVILLLRMYTNVYPQHTAVGTLVIQLGTRASVTNNRSRNMACINIHIT